MLQFSEGPDDEMPRCLKRQRCGQMLLRLPVIDLLIVSPHDWQVSQTSNTLGATNSLWLPGPTFCGSQCWHDGKVLWQSQISGVHVIHTRNVKVHSAHRSLIWKGASFSSTRCICCRDFAWSWEIWLGCCSLRINRTMKEEFEDGEVSKGQQQRSWKPVHTAPTVASLIRRQFSKEVSTATARKVMSSSSSPPPYRKQHLLCVHQLLCK